MADSHPFSNAGLGMFGAEKSYISKGMSADDKNGGLGKLLALLMQEPAQNPYALQQAAVPPSAMGQGVGSTAVPGGLGVNPQQRSGVGLTAPTGLQMPTLPTLPTPTVPQAPAGTGLDINKSLNSFWGV